MQFELLKLLCGHIGTVTIVGDDDQTIYGCNNFFVKNFSVNFQRERSGDTKLE